MKVQMIAAISRGAAIGRGGDVPWELPDDEAFLLDQLDGAFLISGRKSYESPQGEMIFTGRPHTVVTRQNGYVPAFGGAVAHSVEQAFEQAKQSRYGRAIVLGGEKIYELALPYADELLLTVVDTEVPEADAYFPRISHQNWSASCIGRHPKDERHAHAFALMRYTRT
ncbi:dihydrofolate reductase [Phaeodactylibacter luteus]|uniref:dihydrofolate reductase n=1 Tax=Phaeodactylibacter luteus TaxID=1564516 RepID=A0A5C6RH11_9BACT|nr:dihydrofolate reductase [Phaeodactylibacter luteus]TXB61477.1 dihydrofolate reductase [Phaeodactylibacter luteus]